MSWLASRTRDGLGPSALQRQGSGGESLGSLPSRDLLANLDSPSVAPYLQSLMSPREANALPAEPSRPPTTQEAESLENWASLAKRPFSGGALANSSARLFARRLSEAVQRHMAGSDGTPIGHLGQQGHALIERAVHWPARTLRGVIRLLECLDRSPEASFAQFLCLMGDLEMTSRPSVTPPVEKRSSSFFGKIPSLTSPKKVDAARAFYEGFLRNVHKSAEGAPFVVTGYIVVDYAPEILRPTCARLRAAALAAALFAADSRVEQGVCTFTPPSLKGGPETEVRFDATYCSKAPEPVRSYLSTPAGLAAALLDHNDLRNFAPSEQHTKEVQHVYESARRSRLCYAAWLTPFDLHVTPTVSMRCQQCYARDPHAATTAFAVCGAFVPRAAAPPRRFFAEPAP